MRRRREGLAGGLIGSVSKVGAATKDGEAKPPGSPCTHLSLGIPLTAAYSGYEVNFAALAYSFQEAHARYFSVNRNGKVGADLIVFD